MNKPPAAVCVSLAVVLCAAVASAQDHTGTVRVTVVHHPSS